MDEQTTGGLRPLSGDLSRAGVGSLGIYHIHPPLAGPLHQWDRLLAHIAGLGFSHICLASPFEPSATGDPFAHTTFDRLHPALAFDGPGHDGIARIAQMASDAGLRLLLDISPGRVASEAPVRTQHPGWFLLPHALHERDPRQLTTSGVIVTARLSGEQPTHDAAAWWADQLHGLAEAGVDGFRCLDLPLLPDAFWRQLRQALPDTALLAWTSGVSAATLKRLMPVGFDLTCLDRDWRENPAEWFADLEFLRLIGMPLIVPRTDDLAIAAYAGAGLFAPMRFEFGAPQPLSAEPSDIAGDGVDLTARVSAAVRQSRELPAPRCVHLITGPDAPLLAFVRSPDADLRDADTAHLVLINTSARRAERVGFPLDPLPLTAGTGLAADALDNPVLEPSETRVLACRRARAILADTQRGLDRRNPPGIRVAIEGVEPVVPDGDFAAKAVVGRDVEVRADIFTEGHGQLAADLLWRAEDDTEWQRAPMRFITNDRWVSSFRPKRIGLHRFAIEAWRDIWGTIAHDLKAKADAGVNVSVEIEEARAAVREADKHARGKFAAWRSAELHALLSHELAETMRAHADRPFLSRSRDFPIRVDRVQAEFSSWYELFPRSATDHPFRHGTFRSVIGELPRIQGMGFDVLYFTPIHPIGKINRKGRNNAVKGEPDDVGSPYAIGGVEGGHDAVHPRLGTIEDFRALVDAAHRHGIEIALDYAAQCAPDHPWIKQHHDWFLWRPDGSIRFAENPPKKYEDIVNPEFYGQAAYPAVWLAIRDVFQFWIDNGVRIFRVDNPHTKPLPFWEWLIASIQDRHPDVLFLSEAFTRPRVMYRLAKLGFTQSYTYFTWRDGKDELTQFMQELASPPVSGFYRPNFFVNTPDINPYFLQEFGRPGFLTRAALATTLSGNWGMYSGFEICENAPLPGREEYLDSEKYEIRPRNYDQRGNIVEEITRLNHIRRTFPAFRTHLGIKFYNAYDGEVILYGKNDPTDGSLMLVAVLLRPSSGRELTIEIPLWEFGLDDNGTIPVLDAWTGSRFTWTGKFQRIRLDPERPFAIWRLRPEV